MDRAVRATVIVEPWSGLHVPLEAINISLTSTNNFITESAKDQDKRHDNSFSLPRQYHANKQ